MPNPLTRKLRSFADFTAEDESALDLLCRDVRPHRARSSLVEYGDHPGEVHVLLEGWAFRF